MKFLYKVYSSIYHSLKPKFGKISLTVSSPGEFHLFQLGTSIQRRQDTTNKQIRRIHEQKLHKLGIARATNVLEPYKVMFNILTRILSTEQKQTLCLGLDFNISVHKLRYFKYFLVYEK